MRPGAIASRYLITTSLLAAACSVQSDPLTTSSIECTTDEDGNTTCSEDEDKPDGDEGTPGGDLVCSGTGCVSQCEYTDDSFSCTITCENGLACTQTCKEGNCEISCDCPDGGGGGCGDQPTDECCQEHPDDPACRPPCPDGTDNCGCEDGSTDPDCKPPCPDGSTDEECYCQQNPDDPNCQPDCGTDAECYCKEHPDDPACAP